MAVRRRTKNSLSQPYGITAGLGFFVNTTKTPHQNTNTTLEGSSLTLLNKILHFSSYLQEYFLHQPNLSTITLSSKLSAFPTTITRLAPRATKP